MIGCGQQNLGKKNKFSPEAAACCPFRKGPEGQLYSHAILLNSWRSEGSILPKKIKFFPPKSPSGPISIRRHRFPLGVSFTWELACSVYESLQDQIFGSYLTFWPLLTSQHSGFYLKINSGLIRDIFGHTNKVFCSFQKFKIFNRLEISLFFVKYLLALQLSRIFSNFLGSIIRLLIRLLKLHF